MECFCGGINLFQFRACTLFLVFLCKSSRRTNTYRFSEISLDKYKNVEVCEKVMLLYVVVSLFNFTAFLKEKLKCPRLKLDRKLIVIATVIMIITKKPPQVLLQKSITIKIVLA